MKKNYVKVDILLDGDCYFLEGKIVNVMANLIQYQDSHPECEDIRIEIDTKAVPYEDCERVVVNIEGFRPENEVEKKERLAEGRRRRQHIVDRQKLADEQELAEYKRLKKKFE